MFQLQGQQDFVDLAGVGLFRRQVHVARHLHGDGRCALGLLFAQVGQQCARHAFVVHAAVLKKARIFNGQNGVHHQLGDLFDGRQVATLFAKLS